jgi:hypothetical protein
MSQTLKTKLMPIENRFCFEIDGEVMATITKFVSSHTALVTPTDLKTDEVSAIAESVNPLIADSFALYVKTKNYHWHASGSHFRDYHLLFDEQAESLLNSIDTLAERMRRVGATTRVTARIRPSSVITSYTSHNLFSGPREKLVGGC